MAKQHIVTCVSCGEQFDANKGGYYNKSTRRYTCKKCGRKQNTGMRQSYGAMIGKIAAGVLFIAVGFSRPESGWTVGYFLTALCVGAALIAWGLLPYLQARKQEKQQTEAIAKAISVEILRQENEVKTCPSCGAQSKGNYCEYCGSKLS